MVVNCLHQIVNWANGNEGLAAWVQAVGSIVAIVGAFWIVNRQHVLQVKADRYREARRDLRETQMVFDLCTKIKVELDRILSFRDNPAALSPVLDRAPFDTDFQVLLLTYQSIQLPTLSTAIAQIELLRFDRSFERAAQIIGDISAHQLWEKQELLLRRMDELSSRRGEINGFCEVIGIHLRCAKEALKE